mmetsp:Transcript_13329/g.19062  ORF Transcript_13329/g.19062 Transcript_13329/m.19062 type:complete len:196 (+) Transcript_13329:92-679(+)
MNNCIDYDGIMNNNSEVLKSFKSTVEPRKNAERFRLYEFFVQLFHFGGTETDIMDKDVEEVIKNLTTKVDDDNPETVPTDDLDEIINNILQPTPIEEENEYILEEETLDIGEEEVNKNNNNNIHPFSLCDIINEGNKRLHKMNLKDIRIKMKKREKRFKNEQEKIYNAILVSEENVRKEISSMALNNNVVITPSF